MSRTYRKLIFILWVMLTGACGNSVLGATYSIPHNGITDHADAGVSGSIAWYFSAYGAGHTYKLTTSSAQAVYGIKGELHLPATATLTSDLADARVVALSEMNSNPAVGTTMLWPDDGCTVSNIFMDAARNASVIINASHKDDITIDRCDLRDTRNWFPAGVEGRSTIIYLVNSRNAQVRNCTLENAGCNPIIDPTTWNGFAHGIYALDSRDLSIVGCTINRTSGHAISFISARNVLVEGNMISYSGQNARINTQYGTTLQTGGGVGCYHNGHGEAWLNWQIIDNTISNHGSHGIHISGRGLLIQGNRIIDGQYTGISIGDWRDPHDIEKDVWLIDNYIKGYGDNADGGPYTSPMFIGNEFVPGTIHISGTTGNTDVYWGSGVHSFSKDIGRWPMESLAPVVCPVHGDTRTGIPDCDAAYGMRDNHLVLGRQIDPENLSERPTITPNGQVGNALEFDGINDVARSSHAWVDTPDFEIAFDLYAEDLAAGSRTVLSLQGVMSLQIKRYFDGKACLNLKVYEGGAVREAESFRFDWQIWVFVRVEVHDGLVKIAVDEAYGWLDDTYGSIDPVVPAHSSLYLGADKDGLNPFEGRIDEFVVRDMNQDVPPYRVPHADDADTRLLLHMDGSSSGTTPDDDTANPGRNHDGTLLNGPVLVSSFNAAHGNAFHFNGTQRIEVGDSNSDDLDTPETGVRVECYARLDHAKGNDDSLHYLFLQPNRYGILFYDRASGDWRLDFRVWTDAGLQTVSMVVDEPGRWHHYALEYINGTLEGFVDGVSMGTKVGGTTIDPALTKFYIGGNHQNKYRWEGPVDEFRIGTVALSSYEEWFAQYPGLGTETGMADNPDRDSLDNLGEWALGGNPTDPGDIGHVPTFGTDGGSGAEYVYAKRTDADALGLTYSLEESTNLVDGAWDPASPDTVETAPLDAEFDSVISHFPAPSEEQGFIRLRIESD